MSEVYDDNEGVNPLQNAVNAMVSAVQRPAREARSGRRRHLEAEVAAAENVITRATEQLAVLDRYPVEDPFEDGTVLFFRRRFPEGKRRYTYVALRHGGFWYLTGQTTCRWSWTALTEWWGAGVDKVWEMKRSERWL